MNHYGYSLNEAFEEDSQKSDLSQAKCYCYYYSYSYCHYSIPIITTHGIVLPVAALKQGRKAIQFLPLSSDGAIPSDDVIFPSGTALGATDFAAGSCIDSDWEGCDGGCSGIIRPGIGDDGGSASVLVLVVVFAAADVVVIFDGCVFGTPHVCDSVVLTDLSFDNGLLGSHIADFCSGVNVRFSSIDDDDDVILFPWPWAIPKFPDSDNVDAITTILTAKIIIIIIGIIFRDASSFLCINHWKRNCSI